MVFVVYVTLGAISTPDYVLLPRDMTSPLPIVNVNVNLRVCMIVVPIAMVTLFLYFHLYSLSMWRQVSTHAALSQTGETIVARLRPWLVVRTLERLWPRPLPIPSGTIS